MPLPNVSDDLVWELVRTQNRFLVKSKKNGGVQLSRDPFNLFNKHSRTHAGFVNAKAVGVVPAEKVGVIVITKNAGSQNKPAEAVSRITLGPNKGLRKTYKSLANVTAKGGYRADLRQVAVARASAIRRSQKPLKASPEKKLRGAKAKQAAATSS